MPTRDQTSGSRAPSQAPGAPRQAAHLPRRPSPAVVLRLAIGREGIGLELETPTRIGCARVTELAASLPGILFPVDVSGGVARFRHRWSDLQHLEVEVGARELERAAAPKLRGIVGTRTPDVWISVGLSGATACVAALVDADALGPSVSPVVAFDLHVLAQEEDLVLVVTNARGVGLPAPATSIAVGCVEAVLGRAGERRGVEFVFVRPAAALAKALLPEAGARAPSADDVKWGVIAANADAWILQAGRAALPAAPTDAAVSAHETAAMLREADDLLIAGDIVGARNAYLEALERAPRHGEIAQRIIDIDARATGRAEAALAMLAEARERGGGSRHSITSGELLLEIGDVEGALASLERSGEAESAPALASPAFEMAAEASHDLESSAQWLDRALARAPRSTTARWARIEKRLALGRLDDALADAEHLEALARGAVAAYAVWFRAGTMWQVAGVGGRAAALFERALRFAPDQPAALAGLGSALVDSGQQARGASLLARALSLAEDRGEPTSPIALALARALAERLDDLPTAIARVATIPSGADEAPIARGLEGRWRATLGDAVGAGLAFARLRELAAGIPVAQDEKRRRSISELLVEASNVERAQRHDPLAARRYLGDALRLLPHDRELRRLYREACSVAVRERDDARGIEPEISLTASEMDAVSEGRQVVSFDADVLSEGAASEVDIERSAQVEELTRRLHADPKDAATADELAGLLEALGRGHELLALLSAGLADADVERRAVLAPLARAALERLALQAQAAGRKEEASLYRDAATALTS